LRSAFGVDDDALLAEEVEKLACVVHHVPEGRGLVIVRGCKASRE